MKQLAFLCLLTFAMFSFALAAAEMTGLVTCSKCRHTDESSMNCATSCLKGGVPAVFYDQAAQKVYKIANQDAVKAHFGKRVAVTGKVNGENLTVETIKPAPSE